MNALVIVTGPTSSGKTALALELANGLNGELVSADSRQVYQGMDIGTGKDVGSLKPIASTLTSKNPSLNYCFYDFSGVRLWGLDIVAPDYSFNVSDFLEYTQTVLADIKKRGKLPIIVGGTALYIKALLFPPETVSIPLNRTLRNELEKLSVQQLQDTLRGYDPVKWMSMNKSDQNNSRRLIRALEVFDFQASVPKKRDVMGPQFHYDCFMIGLSAPRALLEQKIAARIAARLSGGLEAEREKLLAAGYDLSLPSMTAHGYQSISNEEWKREELGYTKRQMTFLKKLFREAEAKGIKTLWCDITQKHFSKKALTQVEKWYSNSDGAKENKSSYP